MFTCTSNVLLFAVPFNIVGIGTIIDHSQLSQHKLKEMLDNGVIKWSNDKYYTNTTKLGEVIMETMLQEVSDFCKIDMQQNWTMQAHQQVQGR